MFSSSFVVRLAYAASLCAQLQGAHVHGHGHVVPRARRAEWKRSGTDRAGWQRAVGPALRTATLAAATRFHHQEKLSRHGTSRLWLQTRDDERTNETGHERPLSMKVFTSEGPTSSWNWKLLAAARCRTPTDSLRTPSPAWLRLRTPTSPVRTRRQSLQTPTAAACLELPQTATKSELGPRPPRRATSSLPPLQTRSTAQQVCGGWPPKPLGCPTPLGFPTPLGCPTPLG